MDGRVDLAETLGYGLGLIREKQPSILPVGCFSGCVGVALSFLLYIYRSSSFHFKHIKHTSFIICSIQNSTSSPPTPKLIKTLMGSLTVSKLRLEGKVAIITGAASGIGEAAARLFVENGAFVVVADVQDELGTEVVASIGVGKACYKHCDVTDEKQVEELVAFAVQTYGTLDIVYSNAGIMGPLPGILDLDLGFFKKTISINACGGAAVIKHAGRVMVERKIRGSIVCTASIAAARGGVSPVAYTASKHALLGVVRSASRELGAHGIRVNTVSPFGVATPMSRAVSGEVKNWDPKFIDMSRSGTGYLKGTYLQAKNVAEGALFLASDESSCVSGHDLVVDGGYTVSCDAFPIGIKPSDD